MDQWFFRSFVVSCVICATTTAVTFKSMTPDIFIQATLIIVSFSFAIGITVGYFSVFETYGKIPGISRLNVEILDKEHKDCCENCGTQLTEKDIITNKERIECCAFCGSPTDVFC